MSRFTEREHAWFRGRLPDHLLDLLAGDERARFDAHARACAACARLLQSAQGAKADWWDGAGHVPVGALLAWDPGAPDSRRQALVRAHLASCESCRRDLADLRGDGALAVLAAPAASAPVRRAPRPRTHWVPAFGSAAAVVAVLVAVWVLGHPGERVAPAAPGGAPPATHVPPATETPRAAAAPAAPEAPPADVVIAATRRGADEPPQAVTLPAGAAHVRFTLPALDVADEAPLTVELLGPDGTPYARRVLAAARALRPGGVELPAPPAGACILRVRWLDAGNGEATRTYSLEIRVAR